MEQKSIYKETIEKKNRTLNLVLRILLILVCIVCGLLALVFGIRLVTGEGSDSVFLGQFGSYGYYGQDDSLNIVLFLLGLIPFAASLGLLIHSNSNNGFIFDFRSKLEKSQKFGGRKSFNEASKKRKVLFYLSIFFGYLGMDRFACGCIGKGFLKLVLFFFAVVSMTALETSNIALWILFVVTALLTLYFWISDVVKLYLGTFQIKKGQYLS